MLKNCLVFIVSVVSANLSAQGLKEFGSDRFINTRLIIPTSTASPLDWLGRTLSERLEIKSSNVENRPGAGGTVGTYVAAQSSSPTVLIQELGMASASNLNRLPSVIMNDLAPVGLIGKSSMAIMVSSRIIGGYQINSIGDLIQLLKTRGSSIAWANGGSGSASHMCAEMFSRIAKVTSVPIPYRGAGPALLSLRRGETTVLCDDLKMAKDVYLQSDVRILAITSASRSSILPQVPTLKESGVDMELTNWYGLYVPKIQRNLGERISQNLLAALGDSVFIESLRSQGIVPETVENATPQIHVDFLKAEVLRWDSYIRDNRVSAD